MRLRKLALAVGLASTFGAQLASALGVGEIKLNSNLNQPLQAEIKLLEVRDLTEDEILIDLASKEAFQRAGVDRPYFLTDLNFKVDLDSPSGPVVRITSRKPVREPYLNFIIESQWPSGRVLREYTLLLDLPVFSDEASKSVQSARASSAKASPAPLAKPATQNLRSQSASKDVYGPVSVSDTLWEIALQVRPSKQYSVHKTMLAIQRLNPEAFINGNINLLRRGQVLRIPQAKDIDTFSQEQALNEVAFQNSQWSGDESGKTSGPRLDASSSQGSGAHQSTGIEGRLKVAGGELKDDSQSGRGAGEMGGSTSSVQNELSVSLEELDKTQRENADLKDRVAELEAQIKTMERLVEVSNQEMRALQLQVGADDEAADKPLPDGSASEPVDAAADALAAEVAKPEKTAEQEAKAKPADVTKVVRSAQPKEASWLDLLADNILYIGGLLVAVLAAVLLLLRRREAEEEQELDLTASEIEPLPQEPSADDAALDEEAAFEQLAEIAEDEDLLTEEFPIDDSPSEEELVTKPVSTESQTGDAVGEADIYIAYGKLDQAEEMLLKAIAANGADIAARLKLMEVYAETNNQASFEEQFAAIAATGDEASIARAEDLRLDFEGLPSQEVESGTAAIFDQDEMDDSLELSLEDDLLEQLDAPEDSDQGADDAFAFDAQESGDESPLDITLDEEPETEASEDFDLELDLDLDDLDVSETLAESESDEDLDLNLDDSGDLDLSLDELLEDDKDVATRQDNEDLAAEFDESQFELDESLLEDEVTLDFDEESDKTPKSYDLDMDSLELSESTQEADSAADSGTDLDALDDEFDLGGEDLDLSSLDEELASLSSDDSDSADVGDDDLSDELDSLAAEFGLDDDAADSEELAEKSEEVFDLAADLGIDELDLPQEPESETDQESTDDEIFSAALADLPASDSDDLLAADEVTDEDMDAEFDFLADSDEIATKLDLARAYIDMGDQEGAKDILDEVMQEGDEQQRQDAEELISRLS